MASLRNSEEDAVRTALAIPEILETILEFLPTSSLQTVRTVSQSWNEISSSILGKKRTVFTLKIGSIIPIPSRYGTRNSPKIQSQLVRRLKIIDTDCGFQWTFETLLWSRFLPPFSPKERKDYQKKQKPILNFLRMYGDLVEELTFTVDKEFLPTLKTIFGECEFPKLKRITIHQLRRWRRDAPVEGDQVEQLPLDNLCFPKVTRLDYWRMNQNEKEGHAFLPWFQMWINCSPNLEKLFVAGNIYPDLSTCYRIQHLDWCGFPLQEKPEGEEDEMEVRQEFSTDRLQIMLKQIAGTGIERLDVRATIYPYTGIDLDDYDIKGIFDLPHYPRLTRLEISPTNGWKLNNAKLNQANFPLLRILKLNENPIHPYVGEQCNYYFDDLSLDKNGTWRDLEQLTLAPIFCQCLHAIPILYKIPKSCPNLKRLELVLSGNSDYDSTKKEQNLFPWLKAVAIVVQDMDKLEELVIKINSKILLSRLMEGLGRARFTGLKSLQLMAEPESVEDDNSDFKFGKFFLAIPVIAFVNFAFKENTTLKMRQFIKKHGRNNIRFYN